MSSIPEVIQLQETKKRLELAKSFQDDMGAYFFEHTMYDVKDALTSILALCDMADMKQIPQVKKYIQRVSDLMQDVRIYHERELFNLNHVIINVINTLKKNYKDRIGFTYDLSLVQAYTRSSQDHLEQVILYAIVEAVETSSGTLSVVLEVTQKERDALITIKLKDYTYTDTIYKAISDFHDREAFKMQIVPEENFTEISIRLPLSFDVKKKTKERSESTSTISVKAIQKKALYGAQERT